MVLALAAALTGCGSAGVQEGERPIQEMTETGWQCTNCNELIPIGADDKPILMTAEEVEDE
jgi:hypothetical protein